MSNPDLINLGMLVVAIISACIAGGSLWFTYTQWQKLKKKIGMINSVGKAIEIVPAWYTERMMMDQWAFGLLTSDGRILVITNIVSFSDDGKWMDVEMCTKEDWSLKDNSNYIFAVANDRTSASVQVAHVVAAMELITS